MEGQVTSDNPQLIALGALNVDYIYSVDEVTLDGESFIKSVERFSGGSACNTARYLNRWGISSMVAGIAGTDDDGRYFIESLKKEGIFIYIQVKDGSTGRANIFVDKMGRRAIYVMPGVNLLLRKEHLPHGEILRRIKWIHLTSLVGEEAMDSQINYITDLPEHIKVSFSPGMIYSRFGHKRFSDVLKKTEVAFFNSDEIGLFTGEDDVISAIKFLHRMGVRTVSVTMGRDGSILSFIDMKEVHRLPSLAEEIVDTVGAGDAFSAGIIYGMMKGLPLDETHLIAATTASFAVSSRGAGSNIPAIEEILKKKNSIFTHFNE